MTDSDKQELYRIVLARLSEGRTGSKRRHVESDIFAAHNGRPDGFLVTTDNMWLFRQYRNSVSPDPKRLVHEAMDFYREEAET
jgi:sugar lactone lactonase YvrE